MPILLAALIIRGDAPRPFENPVELGRFGGDGQHHGTVDAGGIHGLQQPRDGAVMAGPDVCGPGEMGHGPGRQLVGESVGVDIDDRNR